MLGGPKDKGESEHHAFPDAASKRWVKVTKGTGDSFGKTLDLRGAKWSIGKATAAEYLERIALQNEVFGDDIELHGVYRDRSGNVNIVTSQSDKAGSPIAAPQIQGAMEAAGFISIGDSAFYREPDNVLVLDLHEENAVASPAGKMLVFDAIVLRPDDEQIKRLRAEW